MNDPADILAELLTGSMDARLDDVHVSMPGRIESYDRNKQSASVQPLVRRAFTRNGERVTELLPVITNVPIEFFGGGGYALTFPVVKGMTCRLQFCSVSLDKWLARGGVVEPGDDRKFTLTDAIAVVGLRDFAHALVGLPSNAWVMAAPLDGKILLGSTLAHEAAIKGNEWLIAFNTLIGAIGTAVGTSGTPPGATAAAAAIAAALVAFATASASFLSTRVKLE